MTTTTARRMSARVMAELAARKATLRSNTKAEKTPKVKAEKTPREPKAPRQATGNLAQAGTLTTTYKGTVWNLEVRNSDGKTTYTMADGREFKTLSAAGQAITGFTARPNGWHYIDDGSVTVTPPTQTIVVEQPPAKVKTSRKAKKVTLLDASDTQFSDLAEQIMGDTSFDSAELAEGTMASEA